MKIKVIKGPMFEKVVKEAQAFIGRRALEVYLTHNKVAGCRGDTMIDMSIVPSGLMDAKGGDDSEKDQYHP